MEKKCVKCGHTQTCDMDDAMAECPRCGVIYSKAGAEAECRDVKPEPEPARYTSRKKSIINYAVLGIMVCLFVYLNYRDNKESEPDTDILLPVAGQGVPVDITDFSDNDESPDFEETAWLEPGPDMAETDIVSIDNPAEITDATVKKSEPSGYYLAESTISHGEEVSLLSHMSEGRFTVFVFYADWCPSCRRLSPKLREANKKSALFALRRINIKAWKSPVARQHKINSVPFCVVYNENGSQVAASSDVCRMIADKPEVLKKL